MPLNPPGKICRHQADVVPGNVRPMANRDPLTAASALAFRPPVDSNSPISQIRPSSVQFLQGLQHGGQTDSQPGHNLQLGGSPLLADEPENPRFILSLSPVALFPKSVFLLSIFTRLFPASACLRRAFPFAQAASAAAFSFFVPQAPKNSCAPVHFPLAKPPSLQQSSRLGLFSVYCLSCGKARFPMGFLLIRRQNKQFTLNQAYIFEFLNEFPF